MAILVGETFSKRHVFAAAAHFSRMHDTAGLEFTFRFRRAIPAGTEAILSWEVTAIEPNAKVRDVVR
jgi:hypothetical protein